VSATGADAGKGRGAAAGDPAAVFAEALWRPETDPLYPGVRRFHTPGVLC
jgi:hypothetical protein